MTDPIPDDELPEIEIGNHITINGQEYEIVDVKPSWTGGFDLDLEPINQGETP